MESSKTPAHKTISSRGFISTEEQELLRVIENFTDAIEKKDLEMIMSFYAPEIVAFDMMTALKYEGTSDWRKVWQQALPMMDGHLTSEMRDLSIDVAQDVAICHSLINVKLTGGSLNHDTWMRWTAGFHRTNGNWLITHEHTSVPVDTQTGKAMMDLVPEGPLKH